MKQIDLFSLLPTDQKEKFEKKVANDYIWTFKDYPKIEENSLTAFSCFACGGGSTMGYKLSGVNVLGCVEIDPRMNEVYVRNHNPKYNYIEDIRDFNNREDLPEELYNLDILDGSPPCTTFSMVGLREETWGKTKKFREGQKEQTLDDLSFVFLDTVEKLLPKVVIMENVEGLLLGEAWGYVQRIYERFSYIGYRVRHFLIKGEQAGIPQTRHRVFFIAIRKDLDIDPTFLDMSFNYEPILYKTIKKGFGKTFNKNTCAYRVLSMAINKDKTFSDVYERIGEKPRQFGHRIIWNDDIMATITAKTDIYRGEEKTTISIEDIISAQTFPQDFDFIKRTLSNVSYICGMSVPPIMIKRVMDKLKNQGVFDYKNK